MAKQTNKPQLLKDIQTGRKRLEQTLSALDKDEMIRPGIAGAWSVKDILAHLVAWEELLLDWYQSGIQNRAPAQTPVGMSRKAVDTLNREIYEMNRQRDLDDVLATFHSSFQNILSTIEAIPQEEIFARGRFAWTGRLLLADYIVGNTCNHYAWARAQIRKHLDSAKEEPGPGNPPSSSSSG